MHIIIKNYGMFSDIFDKISAVYTEVHIFDMYGLEKLRNKFNKAAITILIKVTIHFDLNCIQYVKCTKDPSTHNPTRIHIHYIKR